MRKSWIPWLILGSIILLSFGLRVIWQWNEVFVEGQILFRGVDTYYHMRLADYMSINFPMPLTYDLYAGYPEGAKVGFYPLLTWLISLGGKGYETWAVFIPPVLGSLALIPIFILSQQFIKSKLALLVPFLVAILPTEFFHRSLLGNIDHHCLEIILLPTILLFVYLAWIKHKYLYIGLAGLSIALYMLTWQGGPFIALILGLWLLVTYLVSVYKESPDTWICKVIGLSSLIGLLLPLFFILKGISAGSTLIIFISLISLSSILLFMPKTLIFHRRSFIIGLLVSISLILGLSGIFLYHWWEPLRSLFWGFGNYIDENSPSTLPMLFWAFGLTLPLAITGLILWVKNKQSYLITIYTIVTFLALIGQARWSYYTVIPICILSVYVLIQIRPYILKTLRPVVIIIVLIFIIASSFKGTIALSSVSNNITRDWYNTYIWLRANTPEPFSSSESYYESNKEEASYGILSWWDYGLWILRTGHRVPLSSPTHSNIVPSQYLVAATEEEAEIILIGLNIKYIVLDTKDTLSKWGSVLSDSHSSTPFETSQAYRLYIGKSKFYKSVQTFGEVTIWERNDKK